MAGASEGLQQQINDATAAKLKWDAELMQLNKDLVSAKVGKRGGIKKAIKNAEQQIRQTNVLIKKLNDDLAKVVRKEVKNEDNVILAQQGKSPGAEIVNTIGQTVQSVVPVIAGALDSKRSADVQESLPEETKKPFFSGNMIYLVIGAVVLLILMMKKK